ncbi:hypothetical protein J3R30DRAFT_1344387 [Lentinula aciculospora]|uniref:Uncharacterized protein n=1 Tax=Lentinula aciculospora TaxID=153920 RepID=A0A9W9DTQ3_9AGAR|nr:hypothetical protein J3R30DRAFT_1344387 [Lentinula aciculospora]
MRSCLLPSLQTRKFSLQRDGHPRLDVIIEERAGDSNGSDRTFPQAGQSSSPSLPSDFDPRNSDLSLSQSSATSVSEILQDDIWKDCSSLSGVCQSTAEAQFSQDLHRRLSKLLRASEISPSDVQPSATSIPSSSRTQSSTTQSSTTLSIEQRDSILQFQYKRTQSDSFCFTFRPTKLFTVDKPGHKQCLQSPLTRKRPRPSVSFDVNSPFPTFDSPKHKKRRLIRHATVANSNRYATRTASFRRALSLRSHTDNPEKSHFTTIPVPLPNAETSNIRLTLDLEPPPGWIPTAPCSPEPDPPAHSTPLRRAHNYRDPRFDPSPLSPVPKDASKARETSKQSRALPNKVPIIAPPPDHAYSPPLSEASQAKLRLMRFREREQRMREADLAMLQEPAHILADAAPLTLAAEMSSAVSEDRQYFEDVEMYVEKLDNEIDQLDVEDCQASYRSRYEGCSGSHHGLGIRMIQWILEVLPSDPSSSSDSSFSSTTNSSNQTSISDNHHSSFSSMDSSTDSSSLTPERLSDLTEQLLNSPETRFHAAYLFMRFFHLVFGMTQEPGSRQEHVEEMGLNIFSRKFSLGFEGSELVTWDVAVGCLALSVKMHRDFLPPLYPIFSFDYEELAPHDMGYGDLEAAQRDILLALSYNLGSTPQAILDDLWIALPSLRELLDFNEGWSMVLQETWLILFEASPKS